MEIIGYVASAFIGISIGLIGGGGSILTVPVLVYLFGINPVIGTAYSLFVVGSASLVGVIPKFRDGLVNVRTAVVFGVPSIIGVYFTRLYIVPAIPDDVFTLGTLLVTKSMLLMLVFAMLMLGASISMIREKNGTETKNSDEQIKFNYPVILFQGLVVGALTGLVGAGGGFLIIPALVLLSKLPMKEAIGTSLAIMAGKSLIGFLGDVNNIQIDWGFLLIITGIAVAGIFVGNWLSKKIDGKKLKKFFGWSILLMGIFIITKELS